MALFEQWPLLEFSFHAHLGVDLADVWQVKSWRWFAVRVQGLMSSDTPIARFFAPDGAPNPSEAQDVG